jgi:FG-GAP repeat protein
LVSTDRDAQTADAPVKDYVVFGRRRPGTVRLRGGRGVLELTTFAFGQLLGAGDVDGNGHGDLLIANPYRLDCGEDEGGEAWIVRGRRRGGAIDARRSDGYAYHFTSPTWTYLGWGATGLGDANGDGKSDVAIVAAYTRGQHEGYLVAEIALALATRNTRLTDHPHAGVWVYDDTQHQGPLESALALAAAGDVNQDSEPT